MAMRTLPAAADLDHLKGQAKSLLKAAQRKDPDALGRVAACFEPGHALGLQGAQLVLAREYGFSSWSALKAHVAAAAPQVPGALDALADEFLHLVVVTYSEVDPADPQRWQQARELLDAHPAIRQHSLYTAAAIGDVEQAGKWLDEQPELIDRKGGYFDWTPLMYAAYSRLPGISTLDTGKLLIDCGADPNPYYLWGNTYRFTALTGVFGEGESGPVRQPPHPDCVTFARLLLEAGASPCDGQAAYNRMFQADNTCLELLLEYGLSHRDENNWPVEKDGELLDNADNLLHYQLGFALRNSMPSRVRLLVEHGADVNTPFDGRTPHHWALLSGDMDMAEYLVRHGAKRETLSEVDRFRGACLAADREQAESLLHGNASLIEALREAHPSVLHEAASSDNRPAVTLMCDLGINVNSRVRTTPLHDAAYSGHLEMVKLLVDKGADASLRDSSHFGPPINWAEYGGHDDVAAFLLTCKMDACAAAARGKVDVLVRLLDSDPGVMNRAFADVRPRTDKACSRDWMTPLAFAVMNNQVGTTRLLVQRGARTDLRNDAGHSLMEVAREFAGEEVRALLGG